MQTELSDKSDERQWHLKHLIIFCVTTQNDHDATDTWDDMTFDYYCVML